MNFSTAYQQFVWNREGGFVDDVHDRGGATNHGVTIGTFARFAPSVLGIVGNLENLKALTRSQWEKLFQHIYDTATAGRQFKSQAVGEWAHELMWGGGGVWDLQRAYNRLNPQNRISTDGATGNKTVNALNSWTHPNGKEDKNRVRQFLDAIYTQRKQTLNSIPDLTDPTKPAIERYPGWTSRLDAMHSLQLNKLQYSGMAMDVIAYADYYKLYIAAATTGAAILYLNQDKLAKLWQ